MKRHLGFILNIAALALFVPGIFLPMFSLDMAVTANIAGSGLSSELVNKELSLIATVEELWQDQRLLVAALIFAFSICIPLLKTLLVIVAYAKQKTQIEEKIIAFIGKIGKWSMADVFVVAVFLAVLSTNHAETASQQTLKIFSFKLDLLISSETLSAVGAGFYYFTGYCLLSLLANQLSHSAVKS
ncbi:paraquat-inducible protein A [Thalassotalea sp. PLHSN55]|uniref:paraquat-inducible protein A n=1 Tax=Thalassotalea sp. PLHSN55 TaxID=3435888 RepID=UPI003F844954